MDSNELCAICKKRRPTVYITQVDQSGNQTSKKICMLCAYNLGLPQIKDMMNQLGITPEQLESVSDDIDNMMDNASEEDIKEAMQELASGEEPESGAPDENKDGTPDPTDDKDAESRKSATNTPDLSSFFRRAAGFFNAISQTPGTDGQKHEAPKKEGKKPEPEKSRENDEFSIKKFKFLSNYGIDLNQKAKSGKIDAVVGRDRETERVIQILNRKMKNNPALVGEPGVGKTAIAEGLALRIVNKQVPYKLQNKVVVMLDLTAVVAGTQFRGQFESRMKGIIDDVKRAGNIILVIDEVHNIIGAGEAEGSLNAANILKPALSRGEIQVIGTTTLKEYRKYIEKDGALERRFQPVTVEEPSVSETVEILKGIKPVYESFHSVSISDSLIEDIAKLSERYISDRFLPDKAIDVLDEAASRANLRNKTPEIIAEKEKNKSETEEQIQKLESDLSEGRNKPSVVKQNDGENAEIVEDAEIDLFRQIADLKSLLAQQESEIEELRSNSKVELLFDDVAKVIEIWTGIPVNMISAEEAERLLKLEGSLKQNVIGQDRAVEAVSRAIRRNRSGFKKTTKPSSFIFAGPTGVGKTELVKQLSTELFGTTESLIRLDMSEYMEKHTVSKLIGSPPGYVGYDEAGQLTEKVRRHPYSVILFDEIEKAHPDVFNMLLQILDDGRLTDSQGRVVHFENTVIILTTNAYGKKAGVSLGFGEKTDASEDAQKNAEAALKKVFRPEFLNRIDEIILFDSLDNESLKKITRLMLKDVYESLMSKGISVTVTDEAVDFIVKNGYEEEYGARPLRRFIQKKIEDELAEMDLKGELKEAGSIIINSDGREIVISEKMELL